MILLDLKTESIAQVNDLFRVDCTRVKCSDESEADLIEVDLGDGFVVVYNGDDATHKYVDHAFSTTGDKEVTVRATKDEETLTTTRTIKIVSEDEDRLFSSDEDLLLHEEAIHELLRAGKNTFKNIHRLAQGEIIRDLRERFPSKDLSKDSLVEIEQVRAWSKYLTLHYIFESNVRTVDDIHVEKSQTYLTLANTAKNNVPLKVDTDGDGKADTITSFSTIGLSL